MPEFDRAAVETFLRRAKSQTPMPRHVEMYTHFDACLAEIDRLNAQIEAERETNVDMARSALSCYRRGVEEAAEVARCQWQDPLNTKNADKASAWASCAEYIEEHIRALLSTPKEEPTP